MTTNSANMAGGPFRGPADEVIHHLASRQHGVVSRTQLLAAGVPAYSINYRVKSGHLRRVYRGVYRIGPLRGRFEREIAAVLACGATAVLSHRSAAAHWGLLAHAKRRGPVYVSVLQGDPAPGPKVRVHRVNALSPGDRTRRDGIPITVPARTLLDLGACVDDWELEHALARAERKGLTDPTKLADVLERHPRRPGAKALRSLLDRQAGPAFTRSEAESRFLALVRRARLPDPDMNTRLEGYEVDVLWRQARLIVEIDGYAFHSSRSAFEQDRMRGAALVAAGFRVMRLTWRQIADEPEATVARLVRALAQG